MAKADPISLTEALKIENLITTHACTRRSASVSEFFIETVVAFVDNKTLIFRSLFTISNPLSGKDWHALSQTVNSGHVSPKQYAHLFSNHSI